jgi:hypothetical protein
MRRDQVEFGEKGQIGCNYDTLPKGLRRVLERCSAIFLVVVVAPVTEELMLGFWLFLRAAPAIKNSLAPSSEQPPSERQTSAAPRT